MKTITVELTKPLKYTGENGEVEANHVEMHEPTGKQSHICCDIESLIQSGILKMADSMDPEVLAQAKESNVSGDSEEITPDSAMALMMSSGVDMNKITLHFRELFKQLAYMGGEKLFTAARLDDLAHKDLKKMMATYTAVFIMS